MSDVVIKVENLRKLYRLGLIGAQTLREDLQRRWAKLRGKPDPLAKIGQENQQNRDGEYIWALRDVSFEVRQGEILGIIGRNGAGKSTLLKILSHITAPTNGQVRLKGRVGSLLEVGTGFHPELTGRENIFLNGAILGMTKAEVRAKFDEIVEFSGIEKFIDTPVKRYSSGMYVRLAFAVAAHLEPEILIVDEVLAVGDAGFQKKCLGKMSSVAQEGRTVLFVSHNMGAIRGLCERVIWLEEGRIVLTGSVVPVTDQYLTSMLNEKSSETDLRSAKRSPGLGQHLRLVNLELNDGKPILHGERLIVRFDFETYKEVHGVSVGIGFNSIEGIRLMSLDSDLSGARHDLPGRMRGSVEMSLDELFLQPGRYVIDIGARSGHRAGLDYLPACLHVEILPGPHSPSQIIRSDGGVRIPAQWEWINGVEWNSDSSDAYEWEV